MNATFDIDAEDGLVLLADGERPVSAEARRDPERRELRSAAERGDVFYLDAEDPVELRVAIYVEETAEDLPRHSYEPTGGAFLLSLPSGTLQVRGGGELQLPPGAYAVTVLSRGLVDPQAREVGRRSALTPEDWRFRRLAELSSLPGCLLFLAAWVVVFVDGFSLFSLIAIVVALLAAAPAALLTRTRRYRRTDRQLRDHDRSFPHHAIRLQRVAEPAGLVGGHLVVS